MPDTDLQEPIIRMTAAARRALGVEIDTRISLPGENGNTSFLIRGALRLDMEAFPEIPQSEMVFIHPLFADRGFSLYTGMTPSEESSHTEDALEEQAQLSDDEVRHSTLEQLEIKLRNALGENVDNEPTEASLSTDFEFDATVNNGNIKITVKYLPGIVVEGEGFTDMNRAINNIFHMLSQAVGELRTRADNVCSRLSAISE